MKKTKPAYITFNELEKEWMKDPKFVAEWQQVEPHYQLARQIIGARIKKKWSQQQLAQKAKTGQAAISRIENMNAQPTLNFIQRLAQALDTELHLTIR